MRKKKKLWSKFCCLNARRSRRRDNWCRTTTSHGARLVGHTVLLRIDTCVGEQTRLYCRGFLFFAHAVSIIRCLVRRELYNYNLFFHSSSIIRSGFASMTAQRFSCAVFFSFSWAVGLTASLGSGLGCARPSCLEARVRQAGRAVKTAKMLRVLTSLFSRFVSFFVYKCISPFTLNAIYTRRDKKRKPGGQFWAVSEPMLREDGKERKEI